jgi:hypothetical protein
MMKVSSESANKRTKISHSQPSQDLQPSTLQAEAPEANNNSPLLRNLALQQVLAHQHEARNVQDLLSAVQLEEQRISAQRAPERALFSSGSAGSSPWLIDRLVAAQQASAIEQLLAQTQQHQQPPSLAMQIAAAAQNRNNILLARQRLEIDRLLLMQNQYGALQRQAILSAAMEQQRFQDDTLAAAFRLPLVSTNAAPARTPYAIASAADATNHRRQQQFSNPNVSLPDTDDAITVSFEGDRLYPLALGSERQVMSEYQGALRRQICFIQCISAADNGGKTQGRNKPIVTGQVGIICRFCSRLPARNRPRGAVYFPAKLHRIYQAAQNMANNHFASSCQAMPVEVREKLLQLKDKKVVTVGAGKEYWLSAAVSVGVRERDDDGLYFDDSVGVKKTAQPEEGIDSDAAANCGNEDNYANGSKYPATPAA